MSNIRVLTQSLEHDTRRFDLTFTDQDELVVYAVDPVCAEHLAHADRHSRALNFEIESFRVELSDQNIIPLGAPLSLPSVETVVTQISDQERLENEVEQLLNRLREAVIKFPCSDEKLHLILQIDVAKFKFNLLLWHHLAASRAPETEPAAADLDWEKAERHLSEVIAAYARAGSLPEAPLTVIC